MSDSEFELGAAFRDRARREMDWEIQRMQEAKPSRIEGRTPRGGPGPNAGMDPSVTGWTLLHNAKEMRDGASNDLKLHEVHDLLLRNRVVRANGSSISG